MHKPAFSGWLEVSRRLGRRRLGDSDAPRGVAQTASIDPEM